ncbi:MAG: hypothetical protein O3A93_05160 [Chloroflexi bacterium]|nr:hypothetical protein [Chloroflexota bacterium]MDA1270631.1 hypothetical protein [Chloroflexota bacterium]
MTGDEWRCMQCGRYYYPKLATSGPVNRMLPPDVPIAERRQVRQPGGVVSNNPNRLIDAQASRDRQWKDRNKLVVHYLDRGFDIREIAERTGITPRNIRSVRERLSEYATD